MSEKRGGDGPSARPVTSASASAGRSSRLCALAAAGSLMILVVGARSLAAQPADPEERLSVGALLPLSTGPEAEEWSDSVRVVVRHEGPFAWPEVRPVVLREAFWAGSEEDSRRWLRRLPGITANLNDGRYEHRSAASIAHTLDAVPTTDERFETGFLPPGRSIVFRIPPPEISGAAKLVLRYAVVDRGAHVLLPEDHGADRTIYSLPHPERLRAYDPGTPVLILPTPLDVREVRIELARPSAEAPAEGAGGRSPPASPEDVFSLRAEGGDYVLDVRREGAVREIPVPNAWLHGDAPVDEGRIVDGLPFGEAVDAFPIGRGLVGLHLSSYEIQEAGSAMAAAGRDAFLVYDPAAGELSPGGLGLGISKGRSRYMGCLRAHDHRFLVGDVNGDGRADLGVLRRSLSCEPDPAHGEGSTEAREYDPAAGPPVAFYRAEPPSWHVFAGEGWSEDGRFEGRLPRGFRELGLLGIEKSPVDFVWGLVRGSESTRAGPEDLLRSPE